MKKTLIKLIDRYLAGSLSPKERDKLDQLRKSSPEIQADLQKTIKMRELLQSTSDYSFKPFFAERVMNKIKAGASAVQDDFFIVLSTMFRRVAIAGCTVAVLLFSAYLIFEKSETPIKDYVYSQMTLDELVDPATTTSLEDLL
jgi:hypothetical protein